MSIITATRNKLFWAYDRFKGGNIAHAYQELKTINEAGSDSELVQKHQKEALGQLLEHAAAKAGYYGYLKGQKRELNDFPVVDKQVIRSNQDRFLATTYNKDDLYKMATSGSTGTPFVCYQDEGKRKRVNAEVIYYSEKLGYKVGQRIIVLRAVMEQSRKSKPEQWMQNIIQLDISTMDDGRIARLLGEIEHLSRGGALLLAYASTYDILKDYFQRNKAELSYNIFGLVSISEMFFDETREAMAKAFNCRCLSRYSNQENGILGQDEFINNSFLLNEAHYIFEVLKHDSDHRAEAGEVGRIVVTDLFNYAMPMIRYDTGDVGMIATLKQQGTAKNAITGFGGRKIDMIYDTEGQYLSPHKISVAFWSFPELKQFQFVQKGRKEYLVRLNLNGPFDKHKDLEAALIGLLGKSARLEFEYTDDIPVLSSGKRKYIQNNYYKG